MNISEMPKIRIVSDGTSWGTKVFGPDGKALPLLITKLTVTAEPDSVVKAVLHVENIELEVETFCAAAEIKIAP